MDSNILPDLNEIVSPKQQFEVIKQTAENGNLSAMQKLSEYYKNGYGTAVDLEKAEYWSKRASN